MSKRKRFADDGWAIWVTGDDTSTFYLNHWVNPKGNSYVDVAIRIRGVAVSRDLNVYIPFPVEAAEVEDLSFRLQDESVFRAIFSSRCIQDPMKNRCTSELAYHGKTVDLVHISKTPYTLKPMPSGTLLSLSIDSIRDCLDNNEAYFIIRLPHRNLNGVFQPRIDVQNIFTRLRDLLMSPVVSEKYSCSVRVNEARLLPDEINQIGAFHRQKLNKAVITISIHEDYQVNDSNCYRIHRMEESLYANYAPEGFDCGEAIIYEWNESRERNLYGHFNFYFGINRDAISQSSMLLYLVLLLLLGLLGDVLSNLLGL